MRHSALNDRSADGMYESAACTVSLVWSVPVASCECRACRFMSAVDDSDVVLPAPTTPQPEMPNAANSCLDDSALRSLMALGEDAHGVGGFSADAVRLALLRTKASGEDAEWQQRAAAWLLVDSHVRKDEIAGAAAALAELSEAEARVGAFSPESKASKACAEVTELNAISQAMRGGLTEIRVMFKAEDVRRDQIVTNAIRLMDVILKREIGLDLHLLTYRVQPTNSNFGLVEFVPKAIPLYTIRAQGLQLHQVLQQQQTNSTVKEIETAFMRSLAGYSVITYLLGVGDRHDNNVLIAPHPAYDARP